MPKVPMISVGLPVFNGGEKLGRVVGTLLDQTFSEFELIISDNASSDDTEKTCRSFARGDSRIRYVRQQTNLGPEANFRFVLAEARAPFFLWAAADDLRSPDFLEVNLRFLLSKPDYVGSVSPVRFASGDFNSLEMGDASLDQDTRDARVLAFLTRRHANGRFYGLYRTQVVRSWPQLGDFHFLGGDWTFVAHAASLGKINRATDGWLELGRDGMSHSKDIFAIFRTGGLDWIAPLRRTSVEIYRLVADAPLPRRLTLLARLVMLNIWSFVAQFLVLYRSRKNAR
jgi:glycosyltransferase involved in cell wall biosynthesis